jgi:hypothetical protein
VMIQRLLIIFSLVMAGATFSYAHGKHRGTRGASSHKAHQMPLAQARGKPHCWPVFGTSARNVIACASQ